MPKDYQLLRNKILTACPQEHLMLKMGVKGHIYGDVVTGKEYVSVTSKLHIINNPIYQNWRMKQALSYLYDHHSEITPENKDLMYQAARDFPEQVFQQAGDRGTSVHGIIAQGIEQGICTPLNGQGFKDSIASQANIAIQDSAVISAVRGMAKWANDNRFVPLASELKVWSDKYNVAGTLDCVGYLAGKLTLLDFKTSNALRSDYHLQLGAYYGCFRERTGLRPTQGVIIKLDKEHGEYDTEVVPNLKKSFKTFLLASQLYDDMFQLGKDRRVRKVIVL